MSSKAQELVSNAAAKSEPVRILIADDQADVREALRLLLKAEGYATETASTPGAALEAVQSNEFDVLLMDLNYQRRTPLPARKALISLPCTTRGQQIANYRNDCLGQCGTGR